MKTTFTPASFPLPIIRRATGTPFMGYAGATYLVQEFCNALFDALFHILPLGTELDRIEPTPSRLAPSEAMPWAAEAQAQLDALIAAQPVLVQISAAKRMRDSAEREARAQGASEVGASLISSLFGRAPAEATT